MSEHHNKYDSTSIVSIGFALLLIFVAIMFGGNVLGFLDLPSIFIVFGGTFFATTACFTWEEINNAFFIIRKTCFYTQKDLQDAAYFAIKISEKAYKKGVIYAATQFEDDIALESEFFLEGIKLAADNANAEFIEHSLAQKLLFMVERHKKTVSILKKAADIAPAMGLIGTLIGLVQMLANMSDVTKIGPAMSVALLTTFYGAILSYIIFFPLASKLERNTHEEIIVNKIYLETAVSITKKDNPRMLEVVINNILPSNSKIDYFKNN